MLKNKSFENGQDGMTCNVYTPNGAYQTQRGEVQKPKDWGVFYTHDQNFVPEWDPDNHDGWCEPEVQLIAKSDPRYQNPLRIADGEWAMKAFTMWRIHDLGLFQKVEVTPGKLYRFTMRAHAWSSNGDEAGYSDGVGNGGFFALAGTVTDDAARNVTFMVGIDPTGGTNPYASTVRWGNGAHIYNSFFEIPAVETVAESNHITVFVRDRCLWRFKHNDVYFDQAVLGEVVEPEPEPEPEPGGDYLYPVVKIGSKLFGHDVGEGTYDLLQYLAENGCPPPYWKVVATNPTQMPAVANLQRLSPTTQMICRIMEVPGSGVNIEGPSFTSDPAVYMGVLLPIMRQYPGVIYELWNEQDPPGIEGHVTMARFATECMRIATVNGIRLAVMSYSSGVPELEEWEAIKQQTDFFEVAREGLHILSLHVYCHIGVPDSITYHLLRPVVLYETVLPQDEWVPFVFTEYSIDESAPGVGVSDWSVLALMTEFGAIDNLLAQMPYCLGACLYTFGMINTAYNLNELWPAIGELISSVAGRQNAVIEQPEPEPTNCPRAREPYERTSVLLPHGYGFEWIEALRDMWNKYRFTLSGSADDAFIYVTGLGKRRVLALNPAAWNGDLVAFYQLFYPVTENSPVEYVPLDASTPAEWARKVKLYFEPEVEPSYPMRLFRQCDEPWGSKQIGNSVYTVCESGCAMLSCCMWASQKYPDTDPLELVTWLNANGGFTADGNIYWKKPADFYNFTFVKYYTWRDTGQVADMEVVRAALARGPVIIQVDYRPATTRLDTHFVVALREVNGDIEIADPWTGTVRWLSQSYWLGSLEKSIKALVDYRWKEEPPPPVATLLGFNDHPGQSGTALEWLRSNNKSGLIVRPIFLGGSGSVLDFGTDVQRVIVNLRYSWAKDNGGAGTLPLPGTPEWQQFVDAAIYTINNSVGVWGWEIGNEYNNPREFPIAGNLTPLAVAQTYNAIRAGCPGKRLGVGALDPFNAQAGDPRNWLTALYGAITGAELVFAHGYVRGPDAALVGSQAKFSDNPLRWQYLNYPGCITELLKSLPAQYHGLPVYVSEFNHLWKTVEPDWGWVDDQRAGDVVRAALAAARTSGFAGLALYRWAGDEWAVEQNQFVKGVF